MDLSSRLSGQSRQELISFLRERVKELSCLYEFQKIFQKTDSDLIQLLEEARRVIPAGMQHSEFAESFIILDAITLGDITKPDSKSFIEALIKIDGRNRGKIIVYYNSPDHSLNFLEEEKLLLNKLADEISWLVERTEQKAIQQQLEEQMTRSDKLVLVGEIAAGFAHEINTPLGSILGFSELLMNMDLPEEAKRDLQRIHHAALHSREIVKRMMMLSGDYPLQIVPNNIGECINWSVEMLGPQAAAKGVQISVTLDKEIDVFSFDRIQMIQVLLNLISNAVNALHEGGNVYVETRKEHDNIVLIVRDNGPGILPELREKIFTPFFTTGKIGQSAGLGLAVVQSIIRNHGGEITMRSHTGKGTEFCITLPTALNK
ncbi:MAG TPA: HAMP domain-containing sensor histidine kinase [Flavobacteriales bacterium]|nr:HAMP domain-containing sensor histidine kinase [Flavobacteriales bacterium]HRJ35097.1 HAMP domain-containing sensor histidine kinase [Flavobacteriales bacterium]HRJ38165.1 HAMP domain-containing sensor histidine kinase [Flavobacteriales bacterium]